MDSFVGEIRAFAFGFVPQNWLLCDGSLYNITDYPEFYAVIGNSFGGNPDSQFGVPDLRRQVAIGAGAGPGLSTYKIGQTVGLEQVQIDDEAQLPAHTHQANALLSTQLSGDYLRAMPVTDTFITNYQTFKNNKATSVQVFSSTTPTAYATMSPEMLGSTDGGWLSHENRQPYLAMQYCIATVGLYPAPNGQSEKVRAA